jgi:hypothetical protein
MMILPPFLRTRTRARYRSRLLSASDSTVASEMWGDAMEQDQAESSGSDGASPYLSPAFLVCDLGKHRAELAPAI